MFALAAGSSVSTDKLSAAREGHHSVGGVASVTDRSQDDAVLSGLHEHGDRGSISRPVFVWIYGSQSDLQIVQARLETLGWQQLKIEPANETWSLTGQRIQQAASEAIYKMSDEVTAALAGTSADYDGWETSVETGH